MTGQARDAATGLRGPRSERDTRAWRQLVALCEEYPAVAVEHYLNGAWSKIRVYTRAGVEEAMGEDLAVVLDCLVTNLKRQRETVA